MSVTLTAVSRQFGGTPALRAVSLELQAGRSYGLLGRNGAGKTTLIRILLGLDAPDTGSVRLFGGPPNDRARARIGYIPETRALPEWHTVEESLRFVLRVRGQSKSRARQTTEVWMERLGLTADARSRIRTLSNGTQQRVQIALAMCSEPDLIVADEPMTALDLDHQLLVWTLFREAVQAGATLLLCTHRLVEVDTEIEHAVILDRGEVLLDAPLVEARSTPDEPLEALYLRVVSCRAS